MTLMQKVTLGLSPGASRPSSLDSVHRISPPLESRQSYAFHAIPTFSRGLASSSFPKAESKKKKKSDLAQQERWTETLESTAHAPSLLDLSTEVSLIHPVILYLARPFVSRKKAEQFQTAFRSSVVSPASEIGRTRPAVLNIARAAVHNLLSVPEDFPLRSENLLVFDWLAKLVELDAPTLATSTGRLDAESWKVYWDQAEPLLMSIAMFLDMKGYGLKHHKTGGPDES